MQRRRSIILEDLLKELNAKAYSDVFHVCLRDLAEAYEKVYKLKVFNLNEFLVKWRIFSYYIYLFIPLVLFN